MICTFEITATSTMGQWVNDSRMTLPESLFAGNFSDSQGIQSSHSCSSSYIPSYSCQVVYSSRHHASQVLHIAGQYSVSLSQCSCKMHTRTDGPVCISISMVVSALSLWIAWKFHLEWWYRPVPLIHWSSGDVAKIKVQFWNSLHIMIAWAVIVNCSQVTTAIPCWL